MGRTAWLEQTYMYPANWATRWSQCRNNWRAKVENRPKKALGGRRPREAHKPSTNVALPLALPLAAAAAAPLGGPAGPPPPTGKRLQGEIQIRKLVQRKNKCPTTPGATSTVQGPRGTRR